MQKKTGLTKNATKAVAKIAKKVMNQGSETHYVARQLEVGTFTGIYGSTLPTGGNGQLFTCLPQVAEGDASFERNGLKISPIKHRTDLRIAFNDDALLAGGARADQAGWDITCHIWYGYVRRFKNVTDIETTALLNSILTQMLDDGEGNLQGWSGQLTEETLALNREFVSLKHKKVRMYKNAGLANVLDTTSPSLGTPMSEAKRVSLTFKPPKVLQYKDETQLFPENYAPFFIIGYCHNDATPASHVTYDPANPSIANVPALKMYQSDKLWFKDH